MSFSPQTYKNVIVGTYGFLTDNDSAITFARTGEVPSRQVIDGRVGPQGEIVRGPFVFDVSLCGTNKPVSERSTQNENERGYVP